MKLRMVKLKSLLTRLLENFLIAVVVKDNKVESGISNDVTNEKVKNQNILQNCLGLVKALSKL